MNLSIHPVRSHAPRTRIVLFFPWQKQQWAIDHLHLKEDSHKGTWRNISYRTLELHSHFSRDNHSKPKWLFSLLYAVLTTLTSSLKNPLRSKKIFLASLVKFQYSTKRWQKLRQALWTSLNQITFPTTSLRTTYSNLNAMKNLIIGFSWMLGC